MAGTIAEMLVGSVLDSSKQSIDMNGSLKTGAALAETVENIKLNRAKLEQTKAENSLQKYTKVTDLIKIAHESKDPAIADSLWKYAIPKTVKALGADDAFTDEFLETASRSPETREKALGYQLEIERRIADPNNTMSPADIVKEVVATIADPAARAALDTDRIIKAQETKAGEDQLNERNRVTAEASLGKQIQAQNEAGNVEVRKKVGDAHTIWNTGGGASAREKTREIFNKAIKKLQDGKVKFGTLGKNIPWVGNPEKFPIADQEAKALLDYIRGGVSIKEKTGDPNPTQTQIDSIMSRIIDPRLDNAKNIEKLQTELEAMDADTRDKINTFVQHGFMKAEPAPAPAPKEDNNLKKIAGKAKEQYKNLSGEAKKTYLQKFSEKFNTPIDEVKKLLGE